jgi:hypothetical protein
MKRHRRKTPGRPKVTATKKHSQRVNLYLTKRELKALRRHATDSHLLLASAIRNLCMWALETYEANPKETR